jgi:hypothetical protein
MTAMDAGRGGGGACCWESIGWWMGKAMVSCGAGIQEAAVPGEALWRWQAGAVSVARGLVAIRVPDRFVRLMGLAYTGFGDGASAGTGGLAAEVARGW